jgi:hypothetical protein
MPCGLKYQPSNAVSNVGDRDNSGRSMAFQHANDITQVEAPSSTIVWKKLCVNNFVEYTTTI